MIEVRERNNELWGKVARKG